MPDLVEGDAGLALLGEVLEGLDQLVQADLGADLELELDGLQHLITHRVRAALEHLPAPTPHAGRSLAGTFPALYPFLEQEEEERRYSPDVLVVPSAVVNDVLLAQALVRVRPRDMRLEHFMGERAVIAQAVVAQLHLRKVLEAMLCICKVEEECSGVSAFLGMYNGTIDGLCRPRH